MHRRPDFQPHILMPTHSTRTSARPTSLGAMLPTHAHNHYPSSPILQELTSCAQTTHVSPRPDPFHTPKQCPETELEDRKAGHPAASSIQLAAVREPANVQEQVSKIEPPNQISATKQPCAVYQNSSATSSYVGTPPTTSTGPPLSNQYARLTAFPTIIKSVM